MAPRRATASRAASVCSTYTEGYHESFDPDSAQGTFKDTEWVKGVNKDEMHSELLKIEDENADLRRQIKTYLSELTIANDKIIARDTEIAELKSNIAMLKKAPNASATRDDPRRLNERIFSQICDSVESQLAVYRQQFETVKVKYKALEKYKEEMETKNTVKGKRSQQPKKGKAVIKVGVVPEAATPMQGVDTMELSNGHEVQQVQQVQKEDDFESESEQASTSSEEY